MAGFRPRFFVQDPGHWVVSAQTGGVETGGLLELSPEDSHHAVRVLRLAPGDLCEVVVAGSVYSATVASAAMPCLVRLGAPLQGRAAGASYQIAVGLVQRVERPSLLDYVVEKGTEAGATFFLFLGVKGSSASRAPSQRSVRWQRIAREAAKQSKHTSFPVVECLPSLEAAQEWLERKKARSVVLDPQAPRSLGEVLRAAGEVLLASGGVPRASGGVLRPESEFVPETGRPAVALWVGPESGWSQSDERYFANSGMERAKLGQAVLRTETAGPIAVAVARFVLEDW